MQVWLEREPQSYQTGSLLASPQAKRVSPRTCLRCTYPSGASLAEASSQAHSIGPRCTCCRGAMMLGTHCSQRAARAPCFLTQSTRACYRQRQDLSNCKAFSSHSTQGWRVRGTRCTTGPAWMAAASQLKLALTALGAATLVSMASPGAALHCAAQRALAEAITARHIYYHVQHVFNLSARAQSSCTQRKRWGSLQPQASYSRTPWRL